MKKPVVGLLLASLMTLGLVGSTTSTATAVNCSQYTSCIKGKLRVNKINKIQYGRNQRIRIRITLPGGKDAIRATGRVQIRVVKFGGGATVFKASGVYGDKPIYFYTGKLTQPGRWKIKATYVGDAPIGDLTNFKKNFVVKPRR